MIREAFTKWRKTSRQIPTPFDILEAVKSLKRERLIGKDLLTFNDFKVKGKGGWKEYKDYIDGIIND